MRSEYDIIVVGGGHAGTEAAGARKRCKESTSAAQRKNMQHEYDIIVVGGGHAGTEAAGARKRCKESQCCAEEEHAT